MPHPPFPAAPPKRSAVFTRYYTIILPAASGNFLKWNEPSQCRFSKFYIIEFDISESAAAELGIPESATEELGISESATVELGIPEYATAGMGITEFDTSWTML